MANHTDDCEACGADLRSRGHYGECVIGIVGKLKWLDGGTGNRPLLISDISGVSIVMNQDPVNGNMWELWHNAMERGEPRILFNTKDPEEAKRRAIRVVIERIEQNLTEIKEQL